MITGDLEFFKRSELKHPELVDPVAFFWLNEIRREFGEAMVLTDDGRPAGDLPDGADPDGLHPKGRAFDLRSRNWSQAQRFRFVAAVVRVAARMPSPIRGIQLELVHGPADQHFHVGFTMDGSPSTLILALT